MSDQDWRTIQKMAAYLNACFQADNRTLSLWDLLADKNEFLQLANEQQTASLEQTESCVLDKVYGDKLVKNVVVYRREKMLLYGQYFILAQLPIAGGLSKKLSRVCAPLLLYEAEVNETNHGIELTIDHSMYRWNSHLLSLLFDDNDIESKLQDLLDDKGQLDVDGFCALLETSSAAVISEWHVAEPIGHISQLQAAKNAAKPQILSLAPGACFVFTQRSSASRGIIDELNVMAGTTEHAQAVKSLLTENQSDQWLGNRCQVEHVPGILSQAQQQALNNAAKQSLSVLIGPPGTGKSYTIACVILERFLQGESVLLVTQNESAVGVIKDKLTEHLGICASAIIRSGGKGFHSNLKLKLAEILKGKPYVYDPWCHMASLQDILKSIENAESQFIKHAEKAVKDGLFMDGMHSDRLPGHWFNRFKRWLIQGRVNKQAPLAKQLKAIHDLHETREATLAELINQQYQKTLDSFLQDNRQHLVKFDSALRARTSSGQQNRFKAVDYQLLLPALPIWLGSLSSLHRALPMKAELFDLVIIDEATQCDMASCLPALHRAKRVMVVGDPKQLRHLSFLSRKKQQQLLDKHDLLDETLDLNYRDHSMIDLAVAQVPSQDAMVMLDEHYRSMPEIIAFSNAHFYGNQLRIMTAKPTTSKKSAVRLVEVPEGVRKKGVNLPEIDGLFQKLNDILAFQQKLPPDNRQSIGILAFFREQAEAIQKFLLKNYDLRTIQDHKIRAATPYGFQGEERDIMLISCGVDGATPAGAHLYLNRPDVFNVAITRARHLQFIFVSVKPSQLTRAGLLTQYLDHIKHHTKDAHDDLPRLHEHMDQLCVDLQALGLQVVHHYAVAGVEMDLVVVHENQVLVLDLIGFPGEHQDVMHIERYKLFARAELHIYPLSLAAWLLDKDRVYKNLVQYLKDLHQQSLRAISVKYRAQVWKQITAIDSALAKDFRAVEFQLIEDEFTDAINQLKLLIKNYCQLHFTLSVALNEGELAKIRYEKNILAIMQDCLKRYQSMIKLKSQAKDVDSKHLLAANQVAITKFQQSIAKLADTIKSQNTSKVQMTYDFSALDDLNEKIIQFNDMDEL